MGIQTKEGLIRAIAQKLYDVHKDNELLEFRDANRDWYAAERIVGFLETHNAPLNWMDAHKMEDYTDLGFVDMYEEYKKCLYT